MGWGFRFFLGRFLGFCFCRSGEVRRVEWCGVLFGV